MTHHGYLMMGNFYFNEPAHLRGGMPFYFYLLLLAIKTPIPVLSRLSLESPKSPGGERNPERSS